MDPTLQFTLAALAAFLVGSLPIGFWVCRLKGIDVLEAGSRSMGATNVSRLAGKPLGLLVLLLDGLKGFLPLWAFTRLVGEIPAWQTYALAFIPALAHSYSFVVRIYKGRWKAGKGVASLAGGFLALSPALFIPVLGVFFIAFFLSFGRVSVGAIAAAMSQPFIALNRFPGNSALFSFCLLVAMLVLWTHRMNMRRILYGTEPSYFFDRVERETPFFGFTPHPTEFEWEAVRARIAERRYSFLRRCPIPLVQLLTWVMPNALTGCGEVCGIKLRNGPAIGGHYAGIPLCSLQLSSPHHIVRWLAVRRVVQAVWRAYQKGADIVGLAAFASIVGNTGKGVDVVACLKWLGLDIPVTTGNTLTAIAGVEGGLNAYREAYGLDPETVLVVGASGSVGRAAVFALEQRLPGARIIVTARDLLKLQEVYAGHPNVECRVMPTGEQPLPGRLVFLAVSARELELNPEPGTIMVDMSRPRVASEKIGSRPDVLVLDGGMVRMPGNLMYDPKSYRTMNPDGCVMLGCNAETALLAALIRQDPLLRRNWSVGDLCDSDLLHLCEAARKYGLTYSGYRYMDKLLPPERFMAFKRHCA